MQTEEELGADIIMAFDECAHHDVDKKYAMAAMRRTHNWAERCKKAHTNTEKQSLFGIVQGGMFEDLRAIGAKTVDAMDFPGNAIGGLSVGEEKPVMYRLLRGDRHRFWPLKNLDCLDGCGPAGIATDCAGRFARAVDMFDRC